MEQTKEKQKKKMPKRAKTAIIIVSIVLVLAILATVTVGAAIGLVGVLLVGGATATVGALIYFDVFNMEDLEEFFMDDIPELFEELFSEIKGYFDEPQKSFEEIYVNLEKIAAEDIELDMVEGEEETRALLSECFDNEVESQYNGSLYKGIYCENEGDGEWWCVVAFECAIEDHAELLRRAIDDSFYDEDWSNITYHIEGSVLLVGTSQEAINIALGDSTHISTDTNESGGHNHNSSNTNTDEKPNNDTNNDSNENICNHLYDYPCDSTCNSCGEEREASHNMNCTDVVQPTCVEEGYDISMCEYCGWIEHTNFISPNPDDMSVHLFEKIREEPTCTSSGYECYACSACGLGDGEITVLPQISHEYVDGYCTVCGQQKPLYERIDEDTIHFGKYPQTEVTDSTLKTTLNSLAGTKPTSFNAYNWTSYGYYISGSVSNYMWYIDVENGEERYRGVYFPSYRPNSCDNSDSSSHTFQDDNGYTTSNIYWFKYEPISWTILNENNDTALILCDMIIDSQQFDYENGSYYNDYAESTIRAWLNDNFYNTAFDELQKEIILTTTVDNSAASTGYSWNQYACEDTEDKVFLLSYKELTTYLTTNASRMMKTTDYAQSQGAYSTSSSYFGNGPWWLRSPLYSVSTGAHFVYIDGGLINRDLRETSCGVVPALQIQL